MTDAGSSIAGDLSCRTKLALRTTRHKHAYVPVGGSASAAATAAAAAACCCSSSRANASKRAASSSAVSFLATFTYEMQTLAYVATFLLIHTRRLRLISSTSSRNDHHHVGYIHSNLSVKKLPGVWHSCGQPTPLQLGKLHHSNIITRCITHQHLT